MDLYNLINRKCWGGVCAVICPVLPEVLTHHYCKFTQNRSALSGNKLVMIKPDSKGHGHNKDNSAILTTMSYCMYFALKG